MLYGEKGRLFRSWLSRKRYPGDHPDHFLDLRLYYEIFGRKDRCRSYPFDFRFYDRLDSRLDLHDLDETYPAHHSPMITPFDSYSLLRRLPKGGRLILSAPSRFRKAPSCCPVCISYNIRKGDEAPDPATRQYMRMYASGLPPHPLPVYAGQSNCLPKQTKRQNKKGRMPFYGLLAKRPLPAARKATAARGRLFF